MMAEEAKKDSGGSKPAQTGEDILKQVVGERKASKVKALKGKLGGLLDRVEKAEAELADAKEAIRKEILDAGLTVNDIVTG